MRITALLLNFLALTGGVELLVCGLFGVSISGLIFGAGSLFQRIYFCSVGVAAIFFVMVTIIYSPLKEWIKRKP